MSEKKFSVEEAGVRLNLSKHQVYRRIQTGQLSATEERTGKRRFVVAESDIEKYLAGDLGAGEDDGALLKVPAAARILGLSVEMVRKLCEQGELAHRRSSNGSSGGSGHYYIPRESVDEYLSRI
jgi:excisionase family DNA binding protein